MNKVKNMALSNFTCNNFTMKILVSAALINSLAAAAADDGKED